MSAGAQQLAEASDDFLLRLLKEETFRNIKRELIKSCDHLFEQAARDATDSLQVALQKAYDLRSQDTFLKVSFEYKPNK